MDKILIIVCCSLATPTFAYQFLTEEEAAQQQMQIAAANIEQAKQAYLARYSECIEQSKQNILSAADFKHIALDDKELRAVISYFAAKTHRECVGDKAEKYLMAINVARCFKVPEYSVVDDPSSERSRYLAIPLAVDEIYYYPDYLQIAKDKREAIEQIPSIKQVFHITKSFEALSFEASSFEASKK